MALASDDTIKTNNLSSKSTITKLNLQHPPKTYRKFVLLYEQTNIINFFEDSKSFQIFKKLQATSLKSSNTPTIIGCSPVSFLNIVAVDVYFLILRTSKEHGV